MKRCAVIVAGGSGERMNAQVPKQFMLLQRLPVLMHTVNRFYEADPSTEIILVIGKNEADRWKVLCKTHVFTIEHRVVFGGETRYHSVKKGIDAASQNSIVAIHDGVRPFADVDLINRCFNDAERFGNAVPVTQMYDSIRQVEGDHNEPVDRSKFVIVQTPQCFKSEILKSAYTLPYDHSFTDDATVVEKNGTSIHLTKGSLLNIKITYPEDLIIGEAILEKYFP